MIHSVSRFPHSTRLIHKALLIGLLMLLTLVPIYLISDVIANRQSLLQNVQADVANSWGQPQTVVGPYLRVPYSIKQRDQKIHIGITDKVGYLYILPQRLTSDVVISPEVRHRGIFQVNVYQAHDRINASFPTVNLSDDASRHFLLNHAQLVMKVSDLHGLQTFTLQDSNKKLSANSAYDDTVVSDVDLNAYKQVQTLILDMILKGTRQFSLLPIGQQTNVRITSPWINPSFSGKFLPNHYQINKRGFTANWQVPALARSIPQLIDAHEMLNASGLVGNANSAAFGVELANGMDQYRQASRAVNYGQLFIFFTFLTYFLFEVTYKKNIHFIQYGFTAGALLSFFLFLCSLSEILNFDYAYLISAIIIIGQVGFYTSKMFSKVKSTCLFIIILIALYTYLFITLQFEAYALLMGSIGLFVAISLAMYVTRNDKIFLD